MADIRGYMKPRAREILEALGATSVPFMRDFYRYGSYEGLTITVEILERDDLPMIALIRSLEAMKGRINNDIDKKITALSRLSGEEEEKK